jgi:predicted dehydrogenase
LGVEEIIAFDVSEARLREMRERFGVATFDDLEKGLSQDARAALICSPSSLHVEHALAAADADCDLFVEKPLASTAAGVDALLERVAARNLITMVGCNFRFHPGPALIRRLLDEGVVGKAIASRLQFGSYLPDWRPGTDYRRNYSASAQMGGGAVLDCIHDIDLALWFFGPARKVGAMIKDGASLGISSEGLAEVLLAHTGGVVTNIHLSYLQRDYRHTCQVIGEEGTVYWDFERPEVVIYGSPGADPTYHRWGSDWQLNQMYLDELAYFFDCVQSREPTFSTIEHGKHALAVALAVTQSHLAQAIVPLD